MLNTSEISDPASIQTHAQATDKPRRCVLVIDDSVLVREAVKVALGTVGGLDVLVASTGEEGIELAAKHRPDAILLDVLMPDTDGVVVAERLLCMPSTCSLAIVFLTAQEGFEDYQRFARAGVAGVIAKPFDVMSLSAQLAALLGWEL
jgi:CheY-like chemotaxis protein